MDVLDALVELAELSASQWGLLTTAQAAARGVSRVQLARLTDAGGLVRIVHGVYRDAGAPSDEFEELRAAWLSTEPSRLAEERLGDRAAGVVVSGGSAAWLHRVGDLRADRHEFTVPVRRQSQRLEIRYRQRQLDDTDVTIVGGLPVTTLERTVADLVEARVDLSLVAGVLADAVKVTRLDFERLHELLGPFAERRGFLVLPPGRAARTRAAAQYRCSGRRWLIPGWHAPGQPRSSAAAPPRAAAGRRRCAAATGFRP